MSLTRMPVDSTETARQTPGIAHALMPRGDRQVAAGPRPTLSLPRPAWADAHTPGFYREWRGGKASSLNFIEVYGKNAGRRHFFAGPPFDPYKPVETISPKNDEMPTQIFFSWASHRPSHARRNRLHQNNEMPV